MQELIQELETAVFWKAMILIAQANYTPMAKARKRDAIIVSAYC